MTKDEDDQNSTHPEDEKRSSHKNESGDEKVPAPKSDGNQDGDPDDSETVIPEEILDGLDPGEKQILRRFFSMSMSGRVNPIAKKVTSQHITSLISNSATIDQRDRDERKAIRIWDFVYVILFLVVLGLLLWFFHDQPEVITKIVIGVLAFFAGFGTAQHPKFRKKED